MSLPSLLIAITKSWIYGSRLRPATEDEKLSSLRSLSRCIHVRGKRVRMLEWCLSLSDLSSFVQVSLHGTLCTGVLNQWGYADFRKKWEEGRTMWQTESAEWVGRGGGGGGANALKMDQYLYAALCDGVALGANATLAGTMKDTSFWGKGIQDDLLEGGKVNPCLSVTFLNGGWKLSQSKCTCADRHTMRASPPTAAKRSPLHDCRCRLASFEDIQRLHLRCIVPVTIFKAC